MRQDQRQHVGQRRLGKQQPVEIHAARHALDDVLEFNRLNVPREQWLSPTQITEKLGEKGYKVIEIETDDGAYEVEMTDKNGTRIDAHVHPATGELLYGYDD